MSDLISQYPITGELQLSDGSRAPVPYRVSKGTMMFIGGTANLDAVKALLRDQAVVPVATEAGHALMAVWLCDFAEASHGPHHELQFSIFVSHQPLPPVREHRFTVLEQVSFNPAVRMMCHGLWNDSEHVVRFNREALGLQADYASIHMHEDAQTNRLAFAADDRAGQHIFDAELRVHRARPPRAVLALIASFGFQRLRALAALPWLEGRVINPITPWLGRNAEARAFTASDSPVVSLPDARADRLTFHHPTYVQLDFRAQFVQYLPECQFVYLLPEGAPAP